MASKKNGTEGTEKKAVVKKAAAPKKTAVKSAEKKTATKKTAPKTKIESKKNGDVTITAESNIAVEAKTVEKDSMHYGESKFGGNETAVETPEAPKKSNKTFYVALGVAALVVALVVIFG